MTDSVLSVTQNGGIVTLTMSRPEKRNALSSQLLGELEAAVHAACDDPSASVIVLRGSGKAFSAGYDLSARYASPSPMPSPWLDRDYLRRNGRAHEALWNSPLPTIAGVQGGCLAGGADLALHCDFLIMAEDAFIGYPPVRNLGTSPSNLWVYRLGLQQAKRILLTGDTITGIEAANMGLALQACPADQLDDAVSALAGRLALTGRELLIANKWVTNRCVDLMGRSVLNRIAESEDALGHTSPPAVAFKELAKTAGLGAAIAERDAKY
jgi:enoyl-CoA hydratase